MLKIKFEYVTIVSSPITERMVKQGDTGKIDYTSNPLQIRVGANWFNYDDRWIVFKK